MSNPNNTKKPSDISDLVFNLFDSVQAFDDLIDAMDSDHQSFHLLHQLNKGLRRAYMSLEGAITLDLEEMQRNYLKASDKGVFGASESSSVALTLVSSTDESRGPLDDEP